MDNAGRINIVAESNFWVTFLESLGFSGSWVDLDYWRAIRTPDNGLSWWLEIWMIHDLELNLAADVHLDWGVGHDYTWDSDSEDVIDVRVLYEVD